MLGQKTKNPQNSFGKLLKGLYLKKIAAPKVGSKLKNKDTQEQFDRVMLSIKRDLRGLSTDRFGQVDIDDMHKLRDRYVTLYQQVEKLIDFPNDFVKQIGLKFDSFISAMKEDARLSGLGNRVPWVGFEPLIDYYFGSK